MTMTDTDRKDGRVVGIAGPVIDVEFPRGSLPEINSALEFTISVEGNDIKVHRLVLATNCGHAVNPVQIACQIEGSVAYGLSATFYGECAVEKGRMVNLNFDKYEILRLADYPKVETVIVPTGGFWGGVGEPTIMVAAPAVLNAIFAATSQPVRSLPLKNVKLSQLASL